MDEALRERLLERILRDLDRGAEPDVEALAAAHPEHSDTVRELVRAARALAALTPPGSRAPELEPGTRLGDFEVEAPLARGGMGSVYVARQLSLGGRRVALKVVPIEAMDRTQRERAEREALLLAPVHHPHLSEVYGFGREGGVLFIAMQLVEGRDLAELQAELDALRGPAATRRIVEWAAQVAEGLAALHERGLIHRDVKPANVVIERGGEQRLGELPAGEAMLVDFGLVRALVGGSGATTTLGAATPGYAAPEQLLGLDVGPPADTFALGVTLYDLLTGRKPAERAHASAGLDPLDALRPDVDADLAAVVARATDPDPRWRYASGAEFATDLRAWLAGHVVAARHPPAFERTQRWIGAHPRQLMRAALLAACVLVLTALLLALDRVTTATSEARAALEGCDLVALDDAARRVPRFLWSVALRGPELAHAAERLRSVPSAGGLPDVVERLRAADPDGALLAAVTQLERVGYSADPTLRRFVENALRGGSEDAPLGPLAHRALSLVARLFFEMPVITPEELAGTGSLRVLLRELWGREALGHHERLLTLAAFAGCGATDDLDWILAWGLETPAESEEARMSLQCCELILRRSHRAGGLERVDLASLEERFLPFARAVFERLRTREEIDKARRLGYTNAVRRLTNAFAFACNARNEECRLVALAEGDWPETWGLGSTMDIVMCAAPSRLVRWLRGLQEERLRARPASELGRMCGAIDDAGLTALVRERLEDAYPGDEGAVQTGTFDLYAKNAGESRRGIEDRALPDADTLLTASPGPSTAQPLESVQVAAWEGVEDALAAWDFTADAPRESGSARGASLTNAGLARDERQRPYVRFAHFGSAELELRFEVDEPARAIEHEVELVHLAAARAYYPYGGEAYLDVELDGKPLERLLVLSSANHGSRLGLSSDLLWPGEHVLRIRSHPDTTTTYRLKQVVVRPTR